MCVHGSKLAFLFLFSSSLVWKQCRGTDPLAEELPKCNIWVNHNNNWNPKTWLCWHEGKSNYLRYILCSIFPKKTSSSTCNHKVKRLCPRDSLHMLQLNALVLEKISRINTFRYSKQINSRWRSWYLRQAAMMKMMPGARLGMADAIDGDVFLTPSNNRAWNVVTLKRLWIQINGLFMHIGGEECYRLWKEKGNFKYNHEYWSFYPR